jgi:hypothetical protein
MHMLDRRRRLALLIALTFVLGILLAPPAHAATEVRRACVTRGPVSGDTVLVCARLFDDGFRSFYAYGGMDGSNAEPVLYIDALHLRYNLYGLEYVAARAQAKSGRDYINQRTASVTFYNCDADVFAIIGYHIVWQNGQRTPASGQANVRTGTWPACG